MTKTRFPIIRNKPLALVDAIMLGLLLLIAATTVTLLLLFPLY